MLFGFRETDNMRLQGASRAPGPSGAAIPACCEAAWPHGAMAAGVYARDLNPELAALVNPPPPPRPPPPVLIGHAASFTPY